MKKFAFQVVALLIVIFAAFYFAFNLNSSLGIKTLITSNQSSSNKKLTVGNTVLNVEISDTQEKRNKGLSDRDFLAQNSGMLFVFDQSDKYKFWMKDMRFPLDFVWIENDAVVDILPNIPNPPAGTPDGELPIYESVTPVNKVLEVNAGFVASHGIKVGDKVVLEQ